jgi:hypothetical protein
MRIVGFSAVILLARTSGSSAQIPATRTADSVYEVIVARSRAGDTTIDFMALRLAYGGTSAYDPISATRQDLRARLRNAFGTSDTVTSRRLVDSLLAFNYTDIFGHVIAANLARGGGDSGQARLHASVARGLLRSFDASHLGSSTAAPIVIVTAEEEEDFGMATHLERTDRYQTKDCGSRVCDSVVFRNPQTGRDTTVHFDMTIIARKVLGSAKH